MKVVLGESSGIACLVPRSPERTGPKWLAGLACENGGIEFWANGSVHVFCENRKHIFRKMNRTLLAIFGRTVVKLPVGWLDQSSRNTYGASFDINIPSLQAENFAPTQLSPSGQHDSRTNSSR
jgi:hypothetical protein